MMKDEYTGTEHLNITIKSVGLNEAETLAAMNLELIRDEGSENPMTFEQLVKRMLHLLQTEYKAVLIKMNGLVIGYCLYRIDYRLDDLGSDIFVRQFFIKPSYRRMGFGSSAFRLLTETVFKEAVQLKLDVLESNANGKAFWARLGFEPYSHSLRLKL